MGNGFPAQRTSNIKSVHAMTSSHYIDVIMGAMASQITSLAIFYSAVYSGADQRKHPRHWPLCGEFTGDRWISRTNGHKRGKCFHLMTSSWISSIIPPCSQHSWYCLDVSPKLLEITRVTCKSQWGGHFTKFPLRFKLNENFIANIQNVLSFRLIDKSP